MPKVYYEYVYTKIVEDELDIPLSVINRGSKFVQSYIEQAVYQDDYDSTSESEDIKVNFKIEGVQ